MWLRKYVIRPVVRSGLRRGCFGGSAETQVARSLKGDFTVYEGANIRQWKNAKCQNPYLHIVVARRRDSERG